MSAQLADFHRAFPNDADCLDYLFGVRFGRNSLGKNRPKGAKKGGYYRHHNRMTYVQGGTTKHVSPLIGTIFEKSTTPLTLWFYAILLYCQDNKIPAKELERQLNVTYKTAWRIKTQIQKVAMKHTRTPRFMVLLAHCCRPL